LPRTNTLASYFCDRKMFYKIDTRMMTLTDGDKHASLLHCGINYRRNKFYSTGAYFIQFLFVLP
jgi:hypothetical protein